MIIRIPKEKKKDFFFVFNVAWSTKRNIVITIETQFLEEMSLQPYPLKETIPKIHTTQFSKGPGFHVYIISESEFREVCKSLLVPS